MDWILLAGAIGCEVTATLALRAASLGGRRWYAAVVTGYAAAFALLSLALREGLGLGVAYGVWTAVGLAMTSVASRIIYHEPLTWLMVLGMVLITSGVLMIEPGG